MCHQSLVGQSIVHYRLYGSGLIYSTRAICSCEGVLRDSSPADINRSAQSVASCRSCPAHSSAMGTKSRERFTAARSGRRPNAPLRRARQLTGWPARHGTSACSAIVAPAQPSPTLGDALNAGYLYLEVRYLGCACQIRSLRTWGRRKHQAITSCGIGCAVQDLGGREAAYQAEFAPRR